MPQSHQSFRMIPTVKLLEIMLRNGCRPITFHTIKVGDADGWCLKWPVWSAPQCQVAREHGLLLAITWRLGATHIMSIYHDIIKISCKMKSHEFFFVFEMYWKLDTFWTFAMFGYFDSMSGSLNASIFFERCVHLQWMFIYCDFLNTIKIYYIIIVDMIPFCNRLWRVGLFTVVHEQMSLK